MEGGGEVEPRVRARARTRDPYARRTLVGLLGAVWCGPPRERGPHACKRTLLKGRAEPKNRSLKCNDIVVFNARLLKSEGPPSPSPRVRPLPLALPARPFPLRIRPPEQNPLRVPPSPFPEARAKDEEEQIANYPALFPIGVAARQVSSYSGDPSHSSRRTGRTRIVRERKTK